MITWNHKTLRFTVLFLMVLFYFSGVTVAETEHEHDQALPNNTHPLVEFFQLGKSPQTTISPANHLAKEINNLYALTFWVGIGIIAVVSVLFLFFIIRYREKKNPQSQDIHGSNILEIAWTILPIIILVVILIPTVRLIFEIQNYPSLKENRFPVYKTFDGDVQEYEQYLEVNVVGHQWWWEFEYVAWHRKDGTTIPLDRVTANEGWFPVSVPILLNQRSEDVIHSFWLPRLAARIDNIPGQDNKVHLLIDKKGYYAGQCAEYCGSSHALMRFNAKAVSIEEFEKWLNWGKGEIVVASETARLGQEKFYSCLGCHTMKGMKDFIPRNTRLKKGMDIYKKDKQNYDVALKQWREKRLQNGASHFERLLDDHPERPVAPKKPILFRGSYVTIAPDLTDLKFRKKILAGIQKNTKENLKAWILDPPSIKPEIKNTVVIRMPVYKHIFNEKSIDDIIEFLTTVDYTESQKLSKL